MSVVIVNGTDIPTFLFTFCFTISPLFLFVCIFIFFICILYLTIDYVCA